MSKPKIKLSPVAKIDELLGLARTDFTGITTKSFGELSLEDMTSLIESIDKASQTATSKRFNARKEENAEKFRIESNKLDRLKEKLDPIYKAELERPVVGKGVTYGIMSDCYAYTIIEVSANGKKIKIQADRSQRTDNNGQSESQTYDFTRNPSGEVIELFYSSVQKCWKEAGQKGKGSGHYSIGYRAAHQDPHR